MVGLFYTNYPERDRKPSVRMRAGNPNGLTGGKIMDQMQFQDLLLDKESVVLRGIGAEVVTFVGRITNSNSYEVNRKIYHIFDGNNYNIILDLSRLEYTTSTGIAMLISIIFRVKENSGRILVGGLHPFMRNVFSLMDLPPQTEIYDTLEEAKENF